jgi:hypothetical protein
VMLRLDGRAVHPPARVLRVQAERGFAALRVPLAGGGERCLAGSTTWDGKDLTWHHALGPGAAAAGRGRISWRGRDLVETGETTLDGVTRRYEEVWRRLDGDGDLAVLQGRADDGSLVGLLVAGATRAVTVVDHRPAGPLAAVAWRRRDGDWSVSDRIGPGAALPPPPDVIPAVGAPVQLAAPGGCPRWTVAELRRSTG